MKLELPIPTTVSRATKTLEDRGFSAYVVGGCVRDLVLGRVPEDWDITTNATPEEIIALYPKTVYENSFGTVTVINEEETDLTLKTLEITPFRQEGKYSDKRHPDEVKFSQTIEEDLSRRDFTINALAYRISTGELIDLYSGIKDLKDKLIKTVGEASKRLNEDPLRIMRGIRLACSLDFAIETETTKQMTKLAPLIKDIAIERIQIEFNKIIMSPRPMLGLELLKQYGLLEHLAPELLEGVGIEQNGEHIYDVWQHTLRALQHAADKEFGLEVRLSALCHDIGKPRTRRFDTIKQDYTFYGHEVVGAKMAKQLLTRLKYPTKTIETVTKLVRNHMFFSDTGKVTLSAVRRIIANVGRELIWELINVRMADRIGMGRPKEDPYRLRKYEAMIDEALRAPTSVGMLALDGTDLMGKLTLKPGPKIGFILHALLEEVLEDPTKNTKDYLLTKAKELMLLSDSELKKLGESGKEKKDEVEEGELAKIKAKHRVK
ncbi:MAG: HD domain-containing protein [Candidatus Vogelbacteria bacterium]|nr:HD domain-containing protein [Candidatus Vogelbacteria bacterium]